jgi:hypothetical protein
VNGSLLVAYENVLEFVLLEDGVVDVEDSTAGIAEDMLHALFRQATHYNLSARDGSCCFVTHDYIPFKTHWEFDRMLVPAEIRMAQQASGFPSFCGHVDPSGTHRYLTKRRWSQLVQREFL